MKVEKYLEGERVIYEKYKHRATHRVEDSKEMRLEEEIPGMHCKTLFLKDEAGKFYLVGMKASERLDIRKLEEKLNVKKLRFGSEDEMLKEIKIKPGNVSVFCALNNDKVILIVDKKVKDAELVGFHPNVNTETLVLDKRNFEKYLKSLKNKVILF